MYEYKMLQIPPRIIIKAKGAQGQEAALYLQEIASEYAAKGWEFYRVDTVGVVTRAGCLGKLLGASDINVEYYVVTFRRSK